MKNNKFKSKNSIARKAGLLTGALALSLGIFALSYKVNNKENNDPYFNSYKSFYNGNQAQISTTNTPSSTDYISMTAAASANSNNSKIVTISDADELLLFSNKCKTNTAFLGYNYELRTNIDYEDLDTLEYFTPIGYNGTSFTGNFNGNGYEIKNLSMQMTSTSGWGQMKYFSMFSVIGSAGKVHDLGLVQPKLTTTVALDSFAGDGGVSYLVGENNGQVYNSFIVDDGDALDQDAGIAAAGGCRIADLCILNKGTLSNNYIAVSAVVNVKTIDFIEFGEIALKNIGGTITNNFYFNDSIESYNNGTVTYKEEYNLDGKTGQTIGTYCRTKALLVSSVEGADSTWYTSSDYGELSRYVGIKYAIRRGITVNGTTITVNTAKDYAYMYELFNSDDYMASDKIKYEIANNIDLDLIPVSAYTYNKAIGATIEGLDISSVSGITTPELVNNTVSKYPTIYNGDITNSSRVVVSTGVDCYGLFNYVTGTIKNLNVVPKDMDLKNIDTQDTTNVKGIGILAGYIEAGIIDNVNVYSNITNSTNKNIGEYYLGGLTGILGGEAKVSNVTSAGTITLNSTSLTIPAKSSYMGGVAIGGIVGYIENSLGALYTCLNGMNITCKCGASTNYAIGGVIGAGYTMNFGTKTVNNEEVIIRTSNLENTGNISVCDSSNNTYSKLYVSGVFGRHLGQIAQVEGFQNNGEVSVYANGNTTYVSGVENADILTASVANTGLTASQFKNGAGKTIFYGSAFSNGNTVTVTGSSTNLNYTNVLNINAANGIVSTVESIYNLAYYQKYSNSQTKTKTALADQTISLNTFTTFAPTLNVVGGSSTATTTAKSVYNLRNINYTVSQAITTKKTFNFSGVALGEYITYEDIRNEGNLTFTLNYAITADLTISGLFNEVSSSSTANNLYNAGNISITYTAIFTGNIYASGICYANRNGFDTTEIQKYNPSNDVYNKSLIGSINNAINAGEITITSPNFASITVSTENILSPNGQSYLGNTVSTNFSNPVYVNGNIYATGITSINESVITNAFNIANLTAINYVYNQNTKCEINASGISILNIGQFAYIMNCANDGTIKAMNLSSGLTYMSEVNASGITCRNDELEGNPNYSGNASNPNSKQVISFTINYGSVYSYNFKDNITSTSQEPNAKSAGILAMGLCNVINVVNYGNIYGSETASGIFGIVYYLKFTSEVSSNIFIANTLNYGNVYMLSRGYNNVHGSNYPDYYWILYNTFIGLTDSNVTQYVMTSVSRNTDYISVIGSIFAIINFANSNNTDYIKIRYLISFNENVAISGFITGYPVNANPDVSTFYSAHKGVNAKSGAYETDKYMGKYVQYAPLISNTFTGNFVTYIDANENVSTEEKTYNGVFSENFAFMQAIKGNSTYLDTVNYRTDIFISDYFEFIGAVYANTVLLDKIGWSSITYTAAAEAFATSLDGVAKFVTYANGIDNHTHINNLITAALNTDSWINKCDNTILLDLTNTLIEQEDSASLLAMMDYIFTSSSSSYSIITTSTRNAILEEILASDTDLSYSDLLDKIITYTNGYSSLLADSVLNNDEAGQYLNNYILSLDNDDIEDVLTVYCNYLKDASDNPYFTYKNSEQLRYDLLNAMFENINDNSFYQNLAEILEIDSAIGSSSLSDIIKMYQAYSGLSDSDKIALYRAIITNNVTETNVSNLYTFITTMANDISYFNRMMELGYSKTSLTNIKNDISYTSSSTSESVIDERVKLWNQVRKTNVFKSYLQNTITTNFYDLATEYNNTYQSITEPHNNGAYIGDTSDNRLSYMYTLDITPQVNFYGPYINNNGGWFTASDSNLNDNEKKSNAQDLPNVRTNKRNLNVGANTDKYFSIFHYSDPSLWTSNNLMLSRGGENSTTTFVDALTCTDTQGTATYPFPMLIYYDYNNEQLGGANGNYTLSADYYVSGSYTAGTTTFRGFSSNQQIAFDKNNIDDPLLTPITKQKYKSNDWTGTLFKANDLYMRVTNTDETFSLNKAVLAKAYSTGGGNSLQIGNNTVTTQNYRCYIQDSDGAYHLVQTANNNDRIYIGRMVNDEFVPLHTLKSFSSSAANARAVYSFISYEVGLRMYTSCVSPNYHPTGRTGIYRRSGGWNNYFTWKQTNHTRVFTSQYIDYNVDDLLNLDGYLTQYNDGTYKSNDERNIINRLFNEKFINSNSFIEAITAALFEKNMYDTNNQPDINYIDSFFISSIYSTLTVDNLVPLEFLYQTWSSTPANRKTVKKYLTDLIAGNENYKAKFIAYCTSNQSAYAKLLLELINLDNNTYSLQSILDRGIGSSTDSGAMSITNISSYDNVYFVNSPTTINSENLTYGTKFDEITFTLNSEWKKIYLYLMPTETSGTINIKLNSDTIGTDYVVTANSNNYIEVNLNNNTSMTLTANNDVILYKVLVNYNADETTTENDTYTTNIRNSTTSSQQNENVTIPTSQTLISQIEADLTQNSIRYANVQITGISISITGRNNANQWSTYYFVQTGNTDDYIQINGNGGEATFTPLTDQSLLGQTISIYRYNNGWEQSQYAIISKCDVTVNYTYQKTENVTHTYSIFDDTIINVAIQNSHTTEDLCNKTLDESTSYSSKYTTMIENALYGLLPIDYSSTLTNPAHTGTASKNIIEIFGLNETHDSTTTPEYCVPEFIMQFITSSNSAFKSFIDDSISNSTNAKADYAIILRYLVQHLGNYSLSDAIKARTTNLTTNSKFRIAAAYLVSDYQYILNNNLSAGNSILRTYINNVMPSNAQYINQNGTYNSDNFERFCKLIGYDLSTSGYGIYALASNQGKLNGQFIPDNLDITEMDDPYKSESMTYGNSTASRLVLQSSNQNEWRGGTEATSGSVNYAFYVDMKQIQKSISTNVFELSINYGGDTYYGDIDLSEKTVTFYVNTITTGNYNIVNLELAYEATAKKSDNSAFNQVSVTTTTDSAVQDRFIVTAENTDISAEYKIIFKKITVEFDLYYNETGNPVTKTVPASENDTTIVLKLESVTGKELPEGLNLEPYISFVGTETYKMSSEYLTISALSTDHRVDSNGDAIITIVVSYKLPADSYAITVSICGQSASVDYIKEAATGNSIISMMLDGESITIQRNMTATIPFGRAYNYTDLTDPDSENFFLYNFKISSNATVTIEATKTINAKGLMVYTINFDVKSESQKNAQSGNPYTLTLTEKQFFNDNDAYAHIYADGYEVNEITAYDDYDSTKDFDTNYAKLSEEERTKYLSGGRLTYLLSEDTYISASNSWSLTDDMKAEISFNRGYEPQYRIKYNLSNFYTLGSNVTWGKTDATENNGAASTVSYAGLTVTVSDNNDTGVYTFVYTYTNTGTWSGDEEYTRYYEFPELVIIKMASTDALLHQLTFLEESIVLGNTATVILPSTVMVPDKTDTAGVVGYSDDDKIYENEFGSTTRNIVISSKEIKYKNNTDAKSISDYYAIGTVSDADLSYYCPTFKINKYSQMYQYTTTLKLTEYGVGVQTKKDKVILSNHGDANNKVYLYVPFEKDNKDYVFLVELDSSNHWTNVYTTEFNGKAAGTTGSNANTTLIGTFPSGNDAITANNAKGATVGGYTVCDYAGDATNNQSLFMDYVGTPYPGHFWYVSYIIFSEDALTGGTSEGNIRYYHISIIDATNTIQFNVTVYTDTTLNLADIYLTISEEIYKEGTNTHTSTRQISAYAVDTETTYSGTREDIDGYKIYELRYSLQTLPKGYFYFYLDLPNGYVVRAYTDMNNQLDSSSDKVGSAVEEGAFLPYTSIITQKVALELIVDKGTGSEGDAWAVNTTDIYSKKASYYDAPMIKGDTTFNFGTSGNVESYKYYFSDKSVLDTGTATSNVSKLSFVVNTNSTVTITGGSGASYKVTYNGETSSTQTGNYTLEVTDPGLVYIEAVGGTNTLTSIAIAY